jgi:hypothetical protein|tara:strand:+ start:546 stop:989 length:444 start_codon:yes stop_codon:yes gene_type:complete
MFLDQFEETIDEIGFWALQAISKGISDVNMEIVAGNRPLEGSIVVNKVGGIIMMRGYLSGPTSDTAKDFIFLDFDLEWITTHQGKKGQIAKYHQQQFQRNLNSTDQRTLLRHRRQAKQGIMPMDYHQSLNRKQIIGQYYDDGGLVYE